jgi:hypothetical protein
MQLQTDFDLNLRRLRVQDTLTGVYAPQPKEVADENATALCKLMSERAALAVIDAVKQWRTGAFDEAYKGATAADCRSPLDFPVRAQGMIRALFWIDSMCAHTSALVHSIEAVAGADGVDVFTEQTFANLVGATGVYLEKMRYLTLQAVRYEMGLEIDSAMRRIEYMIVVPDDASMRVFRDIPTVQTLFDPAKIGEGLREAADVKIEEGMVEKPMFKAISEQKEFPGTKRAMLEVLLKMDEKQVREVCEKVAKRRALEDPSIPAPPKNKAKSKGSA